MFLLVFTTDRVLVTEDEVKLRQPIISMDTSKIICSLYLRAGACKIRTEHDHPWRLVIEVISAGLETILEQFHISTTTVSTLLVFDFILNDQWLFAKVNSFGEVGRDGVVSSFVLSHETLVTLDDSSGWVLDLPFTDIAEGLAANRSLLGGF